MTVTSRPSTTETPLLVLHPFVCWGCKATIGESDGAVLRIVTTPGLTLEVRQTTPIYCACGGVTLWRRLIAGPTRGPIFQPCYNEAVEV